MDLKLLKIRCKDSKQHHVMFHELYSASSLLCHCSKCSLWNPIQSLIFWNAIFNTLGCPVVFLVCCNNWISVFWVLHENSRCTSVSLSKKLVEKTIFVFDVAIIQWICKVFLFALFRNLRIYEFRVTFEMICLRKWRTLVRVGHEFA